MLTDAFSHGPVVSPLLAFMLIFLGQLTVAGLLSWQLVRLPAHWSAAAVVAGIACCAFLPWITPHLLGPDSYFHYAVSSSYLQDPWQLLSLDSHTVGPLVPGLIALFRWALGWSGAADAQAVSRFLQYLFFGCASAGLVLIWMSGRNRPLGRLTHRPRPVRQKRTGGPLAAFFCVLLIISSGWGHLDFHSYNGEVLALVVLCAAFRWSLLPPVESRLELRALLALLAFYIKPQSMPGMLVILLARNRGLRHVGLLGERTRLAIATAIGFVVTEGMFYLQGGRGLVAKLLALAGYVLPSPGGTAAAGQGADDPTALLPILLAVVLRTGHQVMWALYEVVAYFPALAVALAVYTTACALSRDFRRRGLPYLRLSLAYLAAAIVAMALPGNPFPHYTILVLPAAAPLVRGWTVAGTVLRRQSQWRWQWRGALPVMVVLAVLSFGHTAVRMENLARAAARQAAASDAPPAAKPPQELITALRRIVPGPQDLFVHGFDYSVYVYTGTLAPDMGLDRIEMAHTQGPGDFCDYALRVGELGPRYIIDAVAGHEGVVQRSGLTLTDNPFFRKYIVPHYRMLGVFGGVPVYERTSPPASNGGLWGADLTALHCTRDASVAGAEQVLSPLPGIASRALPR